MKQLELLPIDLHIQEIADLINKHQNVVIKSSPGSGKTTRIPPKLNTYFKKILVLEPRRIAAISAAKRIATEQGWELGEKVGYQVRFDKKYSDKTEIVFLTEALLAKFLLHQNYLATIDLIILDEFHERSQWTDLCLGLIKEWQDLGLKTKLLLLSATLDTVKIKNYLTDCELFELELPHFPLEIVYSKVPLRINFDQDLIARIILSLETAKQKGKENILVFLPGTYEIAKVFEKIKATPALAEYNTNILHGNLPLEEQQRVVTNNEFKKNIILSTNIAESSLTINGVDAVVDSGLVKSSTYNFNAEITELNLKKISLSSAEQRQGRAHRQKPGIVFKLWTPLDEKSMEPFNQVEILSCDLTQPLLYLSHFGISSKNSFSSFSWFESPVLENLKQCSNDLIEKNLITDDQISFLGKMCLSLNLDYHFCIFLFLADKLNLLVQSIELVSLLSEKKELFTLDYNKSEPTYSDLFVRWETFKKKPQEFSLLQKNIVFLQQQFSKTKQEIDTNAEEKKSSEILIKNLILEFNKLYTQDSHKQLQLDTTSKLRFLFDFVFIDKICRRRPSEKNKSDYLNTAANKFSSEVIILNRNQTSFINNKQEFFLNLKSSINTQGDIICEWLHFIPSERVNQLLEKEIRSSFQIVFNENTDSFSKKKVFTYKSMVFKTIEGLALEDSEKQLAIANYLKNIFKKNKLAFKPLNLFFRRISFLKSQGLVVNEENIPWEQIIDDICYNETSLEKVQEKDWQIFINLHLDNDLKLLIKDGAPLIWENAQSEKKFKIDYDHNEAFIEARLQNFIGMKEHPKISRINFPLKIVILGPNMRPIQVTKDIIGFWKSSYPEIRKEMKGRYPKHSWPEDPTKNEF
ncbi:MAG: ATP-dependent RNA helicase [Bdellovibrionaceae bacterium]|nr:ATP-dependent RNA helicase [Pseudobdellovibrionaceae bacterium]